MAATAPVIPRAASAAAGDSCFRIEAPQGAPIRKQECQRSREKVQARESRFSRGEPVRPNPCPLPRLVLMVLPLCEASFSFDQGCTVFWSKWHHIKHRR